MDMVSLAFRGIHSSAVQPMSFNHAFANAHPLSSSFISASWKEYRTPHSFLSASGRFPLIDEAAKNPLIISG
jgi:hypothetical protein